jgi:cytochrome c-type biogenesis protein CcmH/NrfF
MGTEIAPVSGSTGMLWMSCVAFLLIAFGFIVFLKNNLKNTHRKA